MKIAIDHPHPFSLAHGGLQIQIEQTRAALQRRGLDVEWMRWWDGQQKYDLIHSFCEGDATYFQLARAKNLPVVLTSLLSQQCNAPRSTWHLRRVGLDVTRWLLPPRWQAQMPGAAFRAAAVNVVSLACEKEAMGTGYGLKSARIERVPIGLPESFLRAQASTRTAPWLISHGTLTERKRSVELAKLARAARVPVLFVGRPYSPQNAYWRQFSSLIDDQFVHYREQIEDEAELIALLQQARGFVLWTKMENWCLAAHEAAACGLPLLLTRQRWSQELFGDQASYFSEDRDANVGILQRLYESCPTAPRPTLHHHSWDEVAAQLELIYRRVLAANRESIRSK